jgi:maltooligosyltrehalose trehalohydrolase
VSRFRVWAPAAERVRVRVNETEIEATAGLDGWWTAEADAAPGDDYAYLLDDRGDERPDPRSRWQPHGVHGRSRLYDDTAYTWGDGSWAGHSLDDAVIYELHVGTFTRGATFDSAIERLDHLAELGITHVELLPVNAVNGIWNWGYDGVGWYAVHEPYGGPDGLKRFVDACHARGLAVIQDVVYNHLGPSGNYLPEFGPYLKTGRNTWGDLVNVEVPQVRDYIVDNVLMWLRDFHMDALRLDAVHALQDSSPTHILAELAGRVHDLAAETGRPLGLIAESDLNDPTMVTPLDEGGLGMDAQWDDDVHHAVHALITGERQGYYDDFGSLASVAKVLTSAFFHDGSYSTFRKRPHGHPVDRAHIPGTRFVVCLQNHDQVGNRAVGDRLTEITTPGLHKLGALLLLTSAFTPMLWMGEEWAAGTRWPFFTSHPEPELATATGEGRIAEFADMGWDVSQMIDPQDPRAYTSAILNWDELHQADHADMLAFYRRLIALRAAEPDLRDPQLDRVEVEFDEGARWLVARRGAFRIMANLTEQPQLLGRTGGEIVLATGWADSRVGGVEVGAQSAAVVRDDAGVA